MNQLPFTSINYGLDTSVEGRYVTKALLDASMKGVGKTHKTAIFPCGIFQYKKGINDKPGTPNYDLLQKAISSTVRRFYPNYFNCDWSVQKAGIIKDREIKANALTQLSFSEKKILYNIFKKHPDYAEKISFLVNDDKEIPVVNMDSNVQTPTEIGATMGCRTYNGLDINFDVEYALKLLKEIIKQGKLPDNYLFSAIQKDGRGNIAPNTIILPTIAMEAVLENKTENQDVIVDKFMKKLDDAIIDAKDELIERFNHIASQPEAAAKFMYENNIMKGYIPEEGIISALKHGTLALGQIGLAETLQLLIGCNQTTTNGLNLAIKIEELFKKRCAEFKQQYKLNFGVYYTPKLFPLGVA